jgi:protein involved in polysaccharide export with SLBB domain
MRLVCLLLILTLGGCSLWPGSEPPPAPPRSGDVLMPGDNLWIAVAGEEALSGLFPVRSDGTVWVELIGGIPAAGLPLPVFRENLRQRLAAGYLRQPLVEVTRVLGPPAPSLRQSQ